MQHITPSLGHILLELKPSLINKNSWIQCEIDLQMTLSPNSANVAIKTKNGLPDPNEWTKKLVTGIAEVLIGDRPVFQLMRWVSFDVYTEIDKQIKPRSNPNPKRVRPIVRAVHVEATSENTIEASAVIQKGVRGRAMGLKLEAENDRWRCTQLLVA